MRVVSGRARGTKLLAVPGDTTRPVLDRVKTSLFDILRPTLPGLTMLDMFAGSGGIGIEALSQGAAHCVFIDVVPAAVQVIRKNLELTHLAEFAEVRQTDAFLYLTKTERSFDLIYVAPPQYKGIWIEALRAIAERPKLLTPTGQIIVQIDPSEYESVLMTNFKEVDQRRYGSTMLIFLSRF